MYGDEGGIGGFGGSENVFAFAVRPNGNVVNGSRLGSWRTRRRHYVDGALRKRIRRSGWDKVKSTTNGMVLCELNAALYSVDRRAN